MLHHAKCVGARDGRKPVFPRAAALSGLAAAMAAFVIAVGCVAISQSRLGTVEIPLQEEDLFYPTEIQVIRPKRPKPRKKTRNESRSLEEPEPQGATRDESPSSEEPEPQGATRDESPSSEEPEPQGATRDESPEFKVKVRSAAEWETQARRCGVTRRDQYDLDALLVPRLEYFQTESGATEVLERRKRESLKLPVLGWRWLNAQLLRAMSVGFIRKALCRGKLASIVSTAADVEALLRFWPLQVRSSLKRLTEWLTGRAVLYSQASEQERNGMCKTGWRGFKHSAFDCLSNESLWENYVQHFELCSADKEIYCQRIKEKVRDVRIIAAERSASDYNKMMDDFEKDRARTGNSGFETFPPGVRRGQTAQISLDSGQGGIEGAQP